MSTNMDYSAADILKNQASSKDLPYWVPNIDHRITSEVRQTLENYSKIPPDEVVNHVYNIREQAWNIRPWPCTGMGQFFSPSLPQLHSYPEILNVIKSGGHFLDLGCYCGTDLRHLMLDGCPQSNLHGSDLVDHWSLGHDLYRDRDSFHVEFIQSDLLDPSAELLALAGKVDVMGAMHLLHNWDWATQVRGAVTMVRLSKVGAMVVGFQVGTVDEEVVWSLENGKQKPMLHNMATWGRVWEEAGKSTGTEWRVESSLRELQILGHRPEDTVFLGEKARVLEFVARRVS